jgi:hypothetical protein
MSDLIDEAYGYPDDSPKCKTCGVKMINHLGLLGTCKALLEAHRRIGVLECDLAAALDQIESHTLEKKKIAEEKERKEREEYFWIGR